MGLRSDLQISYETLYLLFWRGATQRTCSVQWRRFGWGQSGKFARLSEVTLILLVWNSTGLFSPDIELTQWNVNRNRSQNTAYFSLDTKLKINKNRCQTSSGLWIYVFFYMPLISIFDASQRPSLKLTANYWGMLLTPQVFMLLKAQFACVCVCVLVWCRYDSCLSTASLPSVTEPLESNQIKANTFQAPPPPLLRNSPDVSGT